MRLHNSASWQIQLDEPYLLLLALFMRDAARLAVDMVPSIPPLSPSVAPLPMSLSEQEKVSQQWREWWKRLLDEHLKDSNALELYRGYKFPELPDLAGSPELRAWVQQCFHEATRWVAARRREDIAAMRTGRQGAIGAIEVEVMREIAAQLRRAIRPFVLQIMILPIAGQPAWLLAPDRAIIARNLLNEPAVYRAWLRAVVTPLA